MNISVKRELIVSIFVLYALLAITACAAPVSQTKTPLATSNGALAIPVDIETVKKAESLEIMGQKRISKGEDNLDNAREKVRKGESLINKGNENARESRDRYQSLAEAAGQSTSPDQVADEAKRFKKLADRWDDAIEDIEDGEKLVAKGNTAIEKAESQIRDGRAIVASGKNMLRDAERLAQEQRTARPVTGVGDGAPYPR